MSLGFDDLENQLRAIWKGFAADSPHIRYARSEKAIQELAIAAAIEALRQISSASRTPFVPRCDGEFEFHSRRFRVDARWLLDPRNTLEITVHVIDGRPHMGSQRTKEKIDGYGFHSRIQLRTDRLLESYSAEVMNGLREVYRRGYIFLGEMSIEKWNAEAWALSALSKKLWNVIRMDTSPLSRNLWIYGILDGVGQYVLDEVARVDVLRNAQEKRTPAKSPLELASIFIEETLPFNDKLFSWAALAAGEPITASFREAKYIPDSELAFAEQIIIGSEDIVVRPLVENERFKLLVLYPVSLKENDQSVFLRLQNATRVDSFWNKVKFNIKGTHMDKIVGEVLAHFVKEMGRP